MPYCPECRDEFEDWVTECPDCLVPLVAELPPLPQKPERTASNMPGLQGPPVSVFESDFPMIAHIIAGRLESEGIPAFVDNEHIFIAYGSSFNGRKAVRVLVSVENEEKARQLLDDESTGESEFAKAPESMENYGTPDEYEPDEEPEPAESVTCPRCHVSCIQQTFSLRPFMKKRWKCENCGYEWKENDKHQSDVDTRGPILS